MNDEIIKAHQIALENTWSALRAYNDASKEKPRNHARCQSLWVIFTDYVVVLNRSEEALKNG